MCFTMLIMDYAKRNAYLKFNFKMRMKGIKMLNIFIFYILLHLS